MISLILVMVCAIAAGWLANRVQVPYPIVLVLAGIGLGVAHDWPALDVEPHLVLAIVLPAVLVPGGHRHFVARFPLEPSPHPAARHRLGGDDDARRGHRVQVAGAASALGGRIRAGRDRLAAGRSGGDSGAAGDFRLPRRIVTLLEGESLVNDATGLVLYRFAVAAALTGVFSGWALVGEFGLIALGGLALGIAMGWITSRVQERLHDPMLELAMSLTTPFAAYSLCESLQVSGVLGVVAVGLFRSRWGHLRTSALARLNIRSLLGRRRVRGQLPRVRAHRHPVAADRANRCRGRTALSWQHVRGLIGVLSIVAIGVRFLWIFTATYGVRWLIPSVAAS